jgi:protein involved in polysaccharide export with SLBB domain
MGMKMLGLKNLLARAYARAEQAVNAIDGFTLIAAPIVSLGVAFGALAQGLGSQGISAADLSALKGAAALQNAAGTAGALGAGAGLPGLLAITLPVGNAQEDADQNQQDEKKAKRPAPPLPNEFQKYVLQTTGQNLPLYGADFFENLNNNNGQFSRSPVSDDYVLGAGDQLYIRVWGSTSAEATVTIDRQGSIAMPKLGILKLAGVKAAQVDAVVKAFFSKFYKDIEVSVSIGKIRKITVFVVGQAKNPGSYSLTGQSTLTSALFASGGPNSGGSLRSVQIKRQGQTVAEFDLYNFLAKGDKSQDIKLQDGDVVFYPRAFGYMALMGKVNSQAVYEVKGGKDTVADVLSLSGGLPITADPRRATLERIQPGVDQPRSVVNIALVDTPSQANPGAKIPLGLQLLVQSGDVLTVSAIVPELANAVTLRGAVAQPARLAWRQGMRVSDVITQRSLLISPESVRKQNEVLFDKYEQERTARGRARVPSDLAAERVLLGGANPGNSGETLNAQQGAMNANQAYLPSLRAQENAQPAKAIDPSKPSELTDRDVAVAQLGKPVISEESLADRIGQLSEQVNLDYAVVERFSRETLQVALLPFNLGDVLKSPKGNEDLVLEAGDVITVFSHKDIQIPTSRIKAFVRIEGEVNKPGVYPVSPGDTLKSLIQKAGGITPEAYLFATGLFREDVKKSQQRNMDKLLRKMESESSAAVAQITQSGGASADLAALQAKVQSVQQAQRQSLDRFRMLKPEGRIALGIQPSAAVTADSFPSIRLENGDRITIPPRPDFIQVFGSVNTESALVFKPGLSVKDYIAMAGLSGSADVNGAILVRADGSAMTNQSVWGNDVLSSQVLPGDTIVMPEKFDRESGWSQTVRNAKDFTQVLYQLGLGAAAIKTLRQ